VYSTERAVCCSDDPATLPERAAAIGRNLDGLRQSALGGSAAEVLDTPLRISIVKKSKLSS